ncbi:hypothetical protein E2C01_094780 [Portunus trituberculatus]|uniref:Uncharacterized protein n=1 Tax=Portunus trituberculatus TaxID=210409 RepID=A0A5B7JRB8_PORTR|nr:hypothetical protein [Portunus trituberculatus]
MIEEAHQSLDAWTDSEKQTQHAMVGMTHLQEHSGIVGGEERRRDAAGGLELLGRRGTPSPSHPILISPTSPI